MVVPIIAGGTLLAFIAFGEDLLGKKLFKQALIAGTVIVIGIIGYFVYKIYKAKESAETTITNIYETVYNRITGAPDRAEATLSADERWAELSPLERHVIGAGETLGELAAVSPYQTGADIAQAQYDDFSDRYGVETAEEYAELSGTGRTLVSIGDYISAGTITDAGRNFGNWLNSLGR